MLKKLSIKQKLILIMSIPLMVVILLAAKLSYDSYTSNVNLEKLTNVVVLSTKIGALVHETQKERGMTAGYLGSKGKKFADKLPDQRELASNRIEELEKYLSQFDATDYSEEFSSKLQIALRQLENIENIRNKVSTFKIEAGNAIGYYTKTNALLLNVVSSITKLSNNAKVSQNITSYMNFLLSKERAGIERAVGANTFAQDSFGSGMKIKFITLIAQQDAYMDSFLKVTENSSADFYKTTVQGSAVEKVVKMRAIALKSPTNSNFSIDAGHWFSQITQKINMLKTVENYLSDKLTNTINAELAIAQKDMLIYGLLSALGIALTLILARTIAFAILVDVDVVKRGLHDFFAFINFEKDDIQLLEVKSEDELGNMSRIINENIENTKLNIQADRALIADTIRVASTINQGHLDAKIEVDSNNPALNELKTIINEMLFTLDKNVSNILNVLNSYSKLDYRPKIGNSQLSGIIKELEDNVNILRDSITGILIENKKNGMLLSQNAEVLSVNMNDISTAASSQAASLEQTAASLEEITANISNNTESTIRMSTYGNQVKESVLTGQDLANKTALSMEEINTQTTAITEAITVIDQIAFQTNILSLNAAVEAATAGEAGKGFAVVAQEVRNLASRSAEAAKEIKDLVQNAQTKTTEGKNIATDMISGYEDLNKNISSTLDLINHVSNASKEQSEGMQQINDAVNNLDHITQKNAQNASDADDIAQRTKKISDVIVSNANAKEFDGKDDVTVNSLNLNSSNETSPKTPFKLNKKESDKRAPDSRTHEKPINKKAFVSKNEDAQWESF